MTPVIGIKSFKIIFVHNKTYAYVMIIEEKKSNIMKFFNGSYMTTYV